jgi:hypothetical protein
MSIFTKKDFNSSDGMMTSIWGPAIWHYLHTVSFNYPVEPSISDKKIYTDMLLSIGATLPCAYCRDNFISNLKYTNFSQADMKSRDSFSRFMYKLHNCVNRMLKKNIKISYDEVRDRYENFRSRCITTIKKNKKNTSDKKEMGCVDSLHGVKSKCVINIVPHDSKKKSFNVANKCKLKR